MKETLKTILISGSTGFFAWLFAKLQTRKERKKSDMQIINDATSNLLESIKSLTNQNNDLVKELLEKQKSYLELLREKSEWEKERHDLVERINGLEREIKSLKSTINKYINTTKE